MRPSRPPCRESAVVYEGAAAHVWVVAGDGLLSLRAIRTGRSNDGLDRGAGWIEAGRTHGDQGRTVHRSSGGARVFMNAIVTFALRQRVLIVVLLVMVLVGGVGQLSRAQYRGVSRSGAAAGRHRDAEHRANRPRKSNATSPSRSKSKWPASPMCRPSAPFLCSVCPTSRCSSPTTSPTPRPSNGSPIASRNSAACRTAPSRRYRPPAPSVRYSVIGWSDRRIIRSRT